tara:strand:- start:179 stop:712 length:534 start_codon:yes stop_codon:yes gene_type:complete
MKELRLPNTETVAQAQANESLQKAKSEAIVEAVSDGIEDIERQQSVNEAVANIPEEFEIGERTVKIYSKTAREMVKIDKSIMKLLKIQYERETLDVAEEESFWEKLDKFQEEYYETTFNVLFLIINKDPDNPEFDKDWIMDNIDLMDDGTGEQILDAYNAKCSATNFFQKVLRSRKF